MSGGAAGRILAELCESLAGAPTPTIEDLYDDKAGMPA
jgi:hypothetical protein